MKKALKWIGIGLAGLVGLVVVAGVVLSFIGGSRLNRSYDIQVETIAIPTDEAAIARGRHLAETLTFCQKCHGDNLGGDVFDDEPFIATIPAPNLTSGRGGVGATYSDADHVRAIRHGVNPDGRGLLFMHSDIFHNLSQEDLGAIIAYVKSVPPVDNELPTTKTKPLGRILVALGVFDSEVIPLIPAEVIDHSAPFAEMPAQGATAEYGEYLMSITLCRMCHGSDLRGGPPIDEGAPPGPNLVALGASGVWTEEQFVNTMRTGVTPYGSSLNAEFMPSDTFMKMTDEELKALWLYLQSLEAR